MNWASNSDMLARFGEQELCAVAPSTGSYDVEGCEQTGYDAKRIEIALCDAQSEAESYIATRYPLPLCLSEGQSFPRMLTNAVCDMAMYRLTVGSVMESTPIIRRYEEAVRLLRDVSKGVADLPFLCTSAEAGNNGKVGVEIHSNGYDDFFSKRFTEVI